MNTEQTATDQKEAGAEGPLSPGAGRFGGWLLALAGIFLVAWGLRVAAIRAYEREHPLAFAPLIDEDSYDRWAQDIAAGDWMGDRVFFQEPAYAYALSLVYRWGDFGPSRLTRARHVQAFLGALSAVLIAWLGRRMFGAPAGILAGAIFAIYRPGVFVALLLLKPNLVLPLVAILALLMLSTRERGLSKPMAFGLGLLAGLGALLRGNLLLMIPLFAALPVLRTLPPLAPQARATGTRAIGTRTQAFVRSALIAFGALLALAPATWRNWVVGDQFALTTSGAGTNFYGGNNEHNPYGVATEFDWVRGVPDHEPDDWRREAESRVGRSLLATEVSSYWLGQALESMRSDPLLHAKILLRKLRLTLSSYEVPDNHHLEWDARWIAPLRIPLGGFGVWGWFGLAGIVWYFARALRGREERAQEVLEVTLFLAAYIATLVLTVMSMRARLAIVPLLLPFTGWFLVRIWQLLRARDWRGLGSAALCLFVTGFVHDPVLDQAARAGKLDTRDYNLAQTLFTKDLDQAEEVVASLIARHPQSPRIIALECEIDYRRGHEQVERPGASEAERRAGSALILSTLEQLEGFDLSNARRQDRFRMDYLSGAIRQYLGSVRNTAEDWDLAAEHFEKALGFDPDEPELRRRYAVSLANAAMGWAPEERLQGLQIAANTLRALIEGDQDADGSLTQLLGQVEATVEELRRG